MSPTIVVALSIHPSFHRETYPRDFFIFIPDNFTLRGWIRFSAAVRAAGPAYRMKHLVFRGNLSALRQLRFQFARGSRHTHIHYFAWKYFSGLDAYMHRGKGESKKVECVEAV